MYYKKYRGKYGDFLSPTQIKNKLNKRHDKYINLSMNRFVKPKNYYLLLSERYRICMYRNDTNDDTSYIFKTKYKLKTNK